MLEEVPVLLPFGAVDDIGHGLAVVGASGGWVGLLPDAPLAVEGRAGVVPILLREGPSTMREHVSGNS